MHIILSVIRIVVNQIRFWLLHIVAKEVVCLGKCTSRLNNEWAISKGARLKIGKHVSSLSNCRFLVRGGNLVIEDRVGINSNCIIACHDSIMIGAGTEIGPNVCIYDHDHDFRCEGGIKSGKYKTSPIRIGKNVWIGANVVILRGTTIGDNCVIAAGSIVSGNIPPNTICYVKREMEFRRIEVSV